MRHEILNEDNNEIVYNDILAEALRKYKDKVPFLGDLPLIGRFFRAEGSYNEKKHLLIFVKTNIITPTGELYRDRMASKLASSLEQERADYEEGEQVTEGEEGESEEAEASEEVEESGEETSEETAEETESGSSEEESTEESSEESEE